MRLVCVEHGKRCVVFQHDNNLPKAVHRSDGTECTEGVKMGQNGKKLTPTTYQYRHNHPENAGI